MHSFGYELDGGKKFVVHFDGDCTGYAIWTIVKNNEMIDETHASIEAVQDMVITFHLNPNNDNYIMINDILFPIEAITAALEILTSNRIISALDDKVCDLNLFQLLELEENINTL